MSTLPGFPSIEVDGVPHIAASTYEIEMTSDDTFVYPTFPNGKRVMVSKDRCEHCGRFDMHELVYDWDTARSSGFIVPADKRETTVWRVNDDG